MNYDIKLYVHGVPKGQSTWGVGSSEGNYIETFYGRKSNVSAQMFVEVRQLGSIPYCYYTYLRTGNVCDNSGRAGSYVALTLRINYYYADIKNIYNLLDAAFNKFIVSSIVYVNGEVIKYKVSDFIQADSTLKVLEQELVKYLMQFSCDSDFISLSGFKVNGQNEPAKVNILECDIKTIASQIKNSSSISVSPLYASIREQKAIQKMTAEVSLANAQAQKQIDAVRAKAEKDISVALRDKETGIQAVRNEYKEADKTISSLRHEINNANNEINRLRGVEKGLNQELKNALRFKDEYDKVMKDLDNKNAILVTIRDNLSQLSRITEGLELYETDNNEREKPQKKERHSSLMGLLRKIHPIMDFFVIILLMGFIGITLPKSCSDQDVSEQEIKRIVENVMQARTAETESTFPDTLNDEPNIVSNVVNSEATITQNSEPSLKQRFPNAQIDVAEISRTNPMKCGNTYTVYLKKADENLSGKWESIDFDIANNNKITPKHAGECKISYVVGKDTLVTRTITVSKPN